VLTKIEKNDKILICMAIFIIKTALSGTKGRQENLNQGRLEVTMNTLKQTLAEKRQIDAELRELGKYPVDCSDIPPMREVDEQRLKFGNEHFLKMLPADLLKELARRRLEEIDKIAVQEEQSEASVPTNA
jgi:hypothetical protein